MNDSFPHETRLEKIRSQLTQRLHRNLVDPELRARVRERGTPSPIRADGAYPALPATYTNWVASPAASSAARKYLGSNRDVEEFSISTPPGAGTPLRFTQLGTSPSVASDLEMRPSAAWLLSDPRLFAARLEGENKALRQALAKIHAENGEIVEKCQAAQIQNRELEEETVALLRKSMASNGSSSKHSAPTPIRNESLQGYTPEISRKVTATPLEPDDWVLTPRDLQSEAESNLLESMNSREKLLHEGQHKGARDELLRIEAHISDRLSSILSKHEHLRSRIKTVS